MLHVVIIRNRDLRFRDSAYVVAQVSRATEGLHRMDGAGVWRVGHARRAAPDAAQGARAMHPFRRRPGEDRLSPRAARLLHLQPHSIRHVTVPAILVHGRHNLQAQCHDGDRAARLPGALARAGQRMVACAFRPPAGTHARAHTRARAHTCTRTYAHSRAHARTNADWLLRSCGRSST